VIINCIEDVVTCPGLADRGVFATCNSIPDERRRTEEEVWAEFERSHPRILGALLDAVAHGLRSLPTTRPDKLPRLADFARWVTACEGDLWPQGTFVAAYTKNRAEAAEKLIETDVVATAVQALMAKRALTDSDVTISPDCYCPTVGAGIRVAPIIARGIVVAVRVTGRVTICC
jgi:hypothetical protein